MKLLLWQKKLILTARIASAIAENLVSLILFNVIFVSGFAFLEEPTALLMKKKYK
jgi:hypothetical protein